jgi:alanyl-tRNA synthetase
MLRRTLGEHAKQQGSLVDAGRLRFDFAHFTAVDPTQLAAVETLVNDHLLDNPDIRIWQASRAEAEAAGATALFGEKYGDTVRIVDIGNFSRELCGGTHVGHGSQTGPVRVLGESSIGASLRRIEALTGHDALRFYDHERHLLAELAALLGSQPDDAPAQLRKRLDALAAAQRELHRLRQTELADAALRLAGRGQQVDAGWLVATKVSDVTADELRRLAAAVLAHRRGRPAVVVLATDTDGKASMVAAVSPDLLGRGVQARHVLAAAGKAIGGGAGGHGALANAGGRQVQHLDQALQLAIQDARLHLIG